MNSLISLDDGKTEMSVVVDTTMGGSSMSDGSLEVMVHRRCQKDDSRGVQEPLNETVSQSYQFKILDLTHSALLHCFSQRGALVLN